MTKKHFEALAEIVRDACGFAYVNKHAQRWLALRLAAVCQETNPRFDRERFMRACKLMED